MPWKLDLDVKLKLLLNFLTWSKKHAQLKGLPAIKGYLRDNTSPSRWFWSEGWSCSVEEFEGTILQERASTFGMQCPGQGFIAVVHKQTALLTMKNKKICLQQ